MSAAAEQPRGRRPYRSARRQQQAADTRDAVLAAAGRSFAERGWAATGMRNVASDAGVAVETVYANFSSKADLLLAALDVAVVGDTRQIPMADRPEFLALGDGDPAARIVAGARLNAEVIRRTAGLHRALTHAAASDATLAARLREDEERRRINVEQGAELVAGRPLTDRERDGLWAVGGAEVYLLLTELSGWTHQEYEGWLADTMRRLLDQPPRDHGKKNGSST